MEEMVASRQAESAAAATSKEKKPDTYQSSFAPLNDVPALKMIYWLKGAVVAAACIAIPITLALLRDFDLDETAYYYSVVAPLIILALFEFFIQMQLAPKFGLDMLEEASPTDVSIKAACKTNMTQQGLVATFMLAIVAAMLRHPLGPPKEGLLGQWYEGLLIVSFGLLVSSLCLARLLLMYVEPLDEKATLVFMGNNLAYFGEPLAAASIAVINVLMAICIWVCGVYGLPLAIVAFVIFFIIITRVLVVAQNLSSFKNKQVDKQDGERETRRKWAAKAAGYGAPTTGVKKRDPAVAPAPETTTVTDYSVSPRTA